MIHFKIQMQPKRTHSDNSNIGFEFWTSKNEGNWAATAILSKTVYIDATSLHFIRVRLIFFLFPLSSLVSNRLLQVSIYINDVYCSWCRRRISYWLLCCVVKHTLNTYVRDFLWCGEMKQQLYSCLAPLVCVYEHLNWKPKPVHQSELQQFQSFYERIEWKKSDFRLETKRRGLWLVKRHELIFMYKSCKSKIIHHRHC